MDNEDMEKDLKIFVGDQEISTEVKTIEIEDLDKVPEYVKFLDSNMGEEISFSYRMGREMEAIEVPVSKLTLKTKEGPLIEITNDGIFVDGERYESILLSKDKLHKD